MPRSTTSKNIKNQTQTRRVKKRVTHKTKYIFVTGGVMSGIGKGIIIASLASLLRECGLKLTIKKMDPYLNIDSGTMNPFEHGETFVTRDGLEADLDLGHYERFTDIHTNKNSIITSGKVYMSIFGKERKGEYLGQTVQMIPHVSNEMKGFIQRDSDKYDVILVEIGGTVGDIEGMIHIEAIRQMIGEFGRENIINIHLTYIPFLKVSDEFKTKPAQDSIKKLMQSGIQADIIVCRYEQNDTPTFGKKIALFSNVDEQNIIMAPNIDNIYKLPYLYYKQGFHKRVLELMHMKRDLPRTRWNDIYNKLSNLKSKLTVNLVIKYGYGDAYISLVEALKHAAYSIDKDVELNWIDARHITQKELSAKLKTIKGGILVPGGFGEAGIENKILAIKYAREHNIPFLGICYGMQLMAIEFARHLLHIKDATTQEVDPEHNFPHIVHIINENESNLGGTMRLGDYEGETKKGSIAHKVYGNKFVERHRHRYEINTKYRPELEKHGLVFTGTSGNETYMEIAEIPKNNFMVGVQYHPELNSTIFKPNLIITEFIKAVNKYAS
jgi:CTP synthase